MKKKLYIIMCIFSFCFDRVFALSDIKINNESVIPYFDINTKVYNYFTNKDNVLISISKDKNENVSGYGFFNIINGENIFNINSDKNGEYTIRVYKNYTHDDENIATFKYFNIEGHNIDFKNDIYEYYINTYDNEHLKFNYETDSSLSTVKIENNNDDVIVNINSKNNMNTNKYIIHINKTKSVFKSKEENKELSYNNKKIIIIVIITICSFLIVLCFYLLFVKKIF